LTQFTYGTFRGSNFDSNWRADAKFDGRRRSNLLDLPTNHQLPQWELMPKIRDPILDGASAVG
jgi:hypothetical protein